MSPAIPLWRWLHQNEAPILLLLLLFPLLLLAALRRLTRGASAVGHRKFPPSPPKLPFIGNIHQVGSCIHRSLAALSRKHGQLMLLQLGQVPTLVASSAAMAEEIMKTQDVIFANRPHLEVAKQLFRGRKDIGFTPFGEYWKNLRRICSLHLLNARRVQSYKLTREEEVAFMIEKIEQVSSTSGAVDMGSILSEFMTDLLARVIHGHGRCSRDQVLNRVFRELVDEHVGLLSRFHLGDYYPSLRRLGMLSGLLSRAEKTSQKWEHVLEGVIDAHLHRSEGNDQLHQENFVDALLALQKETTSKFSLTTDTIKALIMDMLVAGIDTTYVTLEWAMAELIHRPETMTRAQAEVREAAEEKPAVEERDMAQNPMNYLRAVIKETLRLHPPGTLLLPRLSSEDTRIGVHDIPQQATVLINAWAIMRDPTFWEAPEEFRPERFLGAAVDFRGGDFQFIPFGAGRRICPGMQFAVSVMELALANLLHRFDWELPDGMRGEDLDMDESPGIITRRKHRLHLVPIRHIRGHG